MRKERKTEALQQLQNTITLVQMRKERKRQGLQQLQNKNALVQMRERERERESSTTGKLKKHTYVK
jgi:hypothetical protein